MIFACRQALQRNTPEPAASLLCSEAATPAFFEQWVRFSSEYAFYRLPLCGGLPGRSISYVTLPTYEQLNRLQLSYDEIIVVFQPVAGRTTLLVQGVKQFWYRDARR
jgi:hypothetical protein